MKTTITPDQMRTLEKTFMEQYQLPGSLLVEFAAQQASRVFADRFDTSGLVLVLCGPGNNGADGYAFARLRHEAHQPCIIWELTENVRGEARLHRRLAIDAGVPILTLHSLPAQLPFCITIADALFGTGLNQPITGIAKGLIELVNQSRLPVLSLDVPSGLDASTGLALGTAIHATYTVTFHRPKQGLCLREAANYVGELLTADIHIPSDFGSFDGLRVLEDSDLSRLTLPRPADAHKGTFGKRVIVTGSEGMGGAAAFAAKACAVMGAGLTQVLCRKSVLHVVQAYAPEATCVVLPEEDEQFIPVATDILRIQLQTATAAAIGPGLGLSEDNLSLLAVMKEASCPVVWDADALTLLANHPSLLPLRPQDVITPHPGEAARLLNCSIPEILADPLTALHRLHERCGCMVILKGAFTLMTNGKTDAVNPLACPGLAKGGSGDVLTGILTTLLNHPCVQGDSLLQLQFAVRLHGLAARSALAELLSQGKNENQLLPLHVISHLSWPKGLYSLETL